MILSTSALLVPTLLGALVGVAARRAPPSVARSVEIDTQELGDIGETVAPRISQAVDGFLAEQGIDASSIRVKINWGEKDFSYVVRAWVESDTNGDAARFPVVSICKAPCKVNELSRVAELAIRRAVAEHKAPRTEPPPVTQVTKPETKSDPDTYPDTNEPHRQDLSDRTPRSTRPEGLKTLGWSGVGALAVGAATMVSGGILVGVRQARPGPDMSLIRDYRPGGFAAIGVGGAFLVGGTVMLALDRSRARSKARKRGRTTALELAPWLSPSRAGIRVSARF